MPQNRDNNSSINSVETPNNNDSKEQISKEKLPLLLPRAITDKEGKSMIQPYLDKIGMAVLDSDVTNIAITGAYGSGKSTVIKTFQEEYNEEKYLNISLASFVQKVKSDNKNDDNSDNKFDDKTHECMSERDIELSILQQIFYQVESSKIPFSRFKRINNFSKGYLIGISLCIALWVYSLIMILSFNKLNLLNPVNWFPNFSFNVTGLILTLIVIVGLIYLIGKIIGIIANCKINKVNIRGEIGLCDRLDKSVFNEYLEEILYFFERTEYNIVVLEDIDRFDSIEIFTKLRELNILINNCAAVNQKVKFIYAIKDEIFKDKSDRVKFFDYIVPIISFINPQSAKEQLSKLIAENELTDILSREFTDKLVFYIDDIEMRLLVNIFNEYLIFKKKLSANKLKQENLFAMVTYKNLFPEDYGKLKRRDGVLYKFISNKSLYVKNSISEIKGRIEEMENEILKIEKEINISISELRMIYLCKAKELIPDIVSFYFNDTAISFKEMITNENFTLLLNEKGSIEYCYSSNNYYRKCSNINFKTIESSINEKYGYQEREDMITAKSNNKIEELKSDIQELTNELKVLSEKSLEKVINENTSLENIEEILSDCYKNEINDDFKCIIFDNPLMRFLLSKGYIDDKFLDYTTIFYAVNLTIEDLAFIKDVGSNKRIPFSTELKKTKEVIKELPVKEFKNECILNFTLLDELLKEKDKHKEKLAAFIKLLSNESDSCIKFIDDYITRNNNNESKTIKPFLNLLCTQWNNIWNYLEEKSNYPLSKIEAYLGTLIRNVDNSTLLELDSEKKLSKRINETSSFTNLIDDNSYDKVTDLLQQLDIKFVKIEDPEKVFKENLSLQKKEDAERNQNELKEYVNKRSVFAKKFLEYIYHNNLYEINKNNLSLFIDKFINIKNHSFETSNYTSICNSEETQLKEYIENDIKTYVNEVFLKLEGNTHEDENSILELLNNDELELDEKARIIDKEKATISDIGNVKDSDTQQLLFSNNKIKATWDNILSYFDDDDLETFETLVEYISISSNLEKLSKQKLGLSDDNSNFINTLFFSNRLESNAYQTLLESINGQFDEFESKELDTEKVESIIKQDKLVLNLHNYQNLKEYDHISCCPLLIEKGHENFEAEIIEQFDEYDLSSDELLYILNSNSFSDEEKFQLIDRIENSSEEIISEKLSSKILSIQLYYKNTLKLSNTFILKLIKKSEDAKNSIKVINLYSNQLTKNEIISLTLSLAGYYKILLGNDKNLEFEQTDYNKELFKHLRELDLIKSYKSLKNGKIRVNCK